MPQCLQPQGHFPFPPPYTLHYPLAPPHYDDQFPPRYVTIYLIYTAPIMPSYNPPESIPFDSPPPYGSLDSITQSKSDDSLDFLTDPQDHDADMDWD